MASRTSSQRLGQQAEFRLPADAAALPPAPDRRGVGVDVPQCHGRSVITGEGDAGRAPGPVRSMRDELPGGGGNQHLALAGGARQGPGPLGEITEQE